MTTRKPQAFVIDDTPKAKTKITIEVEQPETEIALMPVPARPAASRGWGWGSLLVSAVASLVTLWAGFTITTMIDGFFAASPLLGSVALVLAGLIGLATLAIIIREIWGLMRLRRIEKIQLAASRALDQDDEKSANFAITEIRAIYKSKPDAAWNLKNLDAHSADILDPKDRVRLVERYLVDPLDEQAHRIIARRAKRVTLLTTITPAAALDILFVAAQNMAMLREIATLYGGRPSTFATLRLARMVITHLAVAGGLALSENFLHLFVGKGIMGRLSARFGEGAVNGILTSRIGLAACAVCRPIPQQVSKRETLASLLKELATFGDKSETKS